MTDYKLDRQMRKRGRAQANGQESRQKMHIQTDRQTVSQVGEQTKNCTNAHQQTRSAYLLACKLRRLPLQGKLRLICHSLDKPQCWSPQCYTDLQTK